jgi:hypothetical protein
VHFSHRYDVLPDGTGSRIVYTETAERVNDVPYWLKPGIRVIFRPFVNRADRKTAPEPRSACREAFEPGGGLGRRSALGDRRYRFRYRSPSGHVGLQRGGIDPRRLDDPVEDGRATATSGRVASVSEPSTSAVRVGSVVIDCNDFERMFAF